MSPSRAIRISKRTNPERVAPLVQRRLEDGEDALLQAIGKEATHRLLETVLTTLTGYAATERLVTGLGGEVPGIAAVLRVQYTPIEREGRRLADVPVVQVVVGKDLWPDEQPGEGDEDSAG
jgi:stage V sporulation protein SpoVS